MNDSKLSLPQRSVRRTAAVLSALALLGLALAGAARAESPAVQVEAGRRIYLEGVLPDGTPLELAAGATGADAARAIGEGLARAALAERVMGAELEQRGCRVVPEPSLGAGECRVEGPHAQVDATLATRWRKAIAPLGATRDWLD